MKNGGFKCVKVYLYLKSSYEDKNCKGDCPNCVKKGNKF